MSSSKIKGTYKIDPDLFAEFKEIEESSGRKIIWTDEMDGLILEFWIKSNKMAFAKKFREKYGFGSNNTILTRFRELTIKPNHIGPDEYGLMAPEKGV